MIASYPLNLNEVPDMYVNCWRNALVSFVRYSRQTNRILPIFLFNESHKLEERDIEMLFIKTY